jgi:hypothetical protein
MAILTFAAQGVDGLGLRHGSAYPRTQPEQDFAQPGGIHLMQMLSVHNQVGAALALILAKTSRHSNRILHAMIQQVRFDRGKILRVPSRKA